MNAQRAFRMSVINAIAEVRAFRSKAGSLQITECCRILRVTPGASATFDYNAVVELEEFWHLFDGPAGPRDEIVRQVLRALILHIRPTWGLLLQHGRQAIRQNVPEDVKQCFETAGFFKDLADPDGVAWWDELSNIFRSASVLGRVDLGRQGEMLSMDHERDRLSALGYSGVEPLWVAIEDETLGYDVVSCEPGGGTTKKIHIEVKASERSPFVFFLTENEWKVAQALNDLYRFHLWHIPSKTLTTATVRDVAPHIPTNQGSGTWKKIQIVWGQ